MSEPSVPPPPPPYYTPPPPPPPGGPAAGGVSPNRSVMIVLSYLGLLALIPLLVEKDDAEVQWHAKHGLVLLGLDIVVLFVAKIMLIVPFLGCFVWIAACLALLVLHVLCIIKGLSGQRFIIPGITPLVDRF